eukprot:5575844-Pyramimonas_sp.AAC.1
MTMTVMVMAAMATAMAVVMTMAITMTIAMMFTAACMLMARIAMKTMAATRATWWDVMALQPGN